MSRDQFPPLHVFIDSSEPGLEDVYALRIEQSSPLEIFEDLIERLSDKPEIVKCGQQAKQKSGVPSDLEAFLLGQIPGEVRAIFEGRNVTHPIGLSVQEARNCLYDEARTKTFLLGLKEEIEARRDHSIINVFDAGCGPIPIFPIYAALLSPKVRVTCLEVNEDSKKVAEAVIRSFGLEEQVKILCADAVSYSPDRKVDILISETIQAGLVHEQIVPIINSQRQHLRENGTVLPSQITLHAGLVLMDKLHSPESQAHIAGSYIPLLPVNSLSTFTWDTKDRLEQVSMEFRVPPDLEDGMYVVVVGTEIRVGNRIIPSNDSLTTVTIAAYYRFSDSIMPVSPILHSGKLVSINYRPPQDPYCTIQYNE